MLSPANGKINEKRNDGCVRTIDICHHKGHSFNVVGLQDLSNSSKKPMETGRSGICSNSVRAKTSLASMKCNFVELDSILKTRAENLIYSTSYSGLRQAGATPPTPDPEAWEFSASLIGLTLGNHGSAPAWVPPCKRKNE